MTFARTATAEVCENPNATTVATPAFTSVSGRLIAGYVGWEGGTTSLSLADTAGNIYVVGAITPHGTVPDNVIAPFYCLSSNGNASNVVTAMFGAARSVRVIQLAEYSTSGSAIYDGVSFASTTTISTTSAGITTTGAVGLLFAGAKSHNSTTLGVSGSLSFISQIGNFGGDAEQFITSAGSYTASITNTSNATMSVVVLAFKEGASGPTVSTITIGSVTEGGAASVTVALSGATSASTNFACSHVGVDATGADLTLSLNGVTCTNGVTCDGTNFSVPSGVSGWSFNVQTTADTLDEADETATITIGGVSATITITDDDATPAIIIPGPVTVDSGDSVVASYTLGAVSGRVTYARLVLTDGTAVGGTDYTNIITDPMLSDGVTISAGVLSIPAGVTEFTLTITTTA